MFTASQHPAALWKTWCLCLVSSSHLNLVNILHHDFKKCKHKMTVCKKHLFFRQGKSGTQQAGTGLRTIFQAHHDRQIFRPDR